MKRIVMTDDSSKWFDADTAVLFKEDTRWNGNNHISKATGSQWGHEWLYYTKSGRWVLNSFSNYQNVAERYETIGEDAAIAWLISQGHFEHGGLEQLPKALAERVKEGMTAAEL